MVANVLNEDEMAIEIGNDWLSCTIRTVEAVMERHGFHEDVKPETQPLAKPFTDGNISGWRQLLRRVASLSRS